MLTVDMPTFYLCLDASFKKKGMQGAYFMRLLTKGGHHLCKLSSSDFLPKSGSAQNTLEQKAGISLSGNGFITWVQQASLFKHIDIYY